MASVKNPIVTMFFSQGRFTWQESHYFLPGTDMVPDQLQDLVEMAFANLAVKRAKLLGSGAQLDAVKASFGLAWRDSAWIGVSGPGNTLNSLIVQLSDFGVANPADSPESVTVMRLNMGQNYRKLLYLGGFPKVVQPYPPPVEWPAAFQAAWSDYGSYLCSATAPLVGRWGSVVRTKNVTNPPLSNLTAVTLGNGAPQTATFTYGAAGAGGVVPYKGAMVRILGVKTQGGLGRTVLNGVYPVIDLAAGPPSTFTVDLRGDGVPNAAHIDMTGAYYWVLQDLAVSYSDYGWDRQTHRKRGEGVGAPKARHPRAS